MDGARLGFQATMLGTPKSDGNAGIFVDRSGQRLALRVRKKDAAPDAAGLPIEGVTFKSFGEPLIGGAPVEHAFLGKLAGKGITPANDEGLWVGTNTELRLIAREGDEADALPAGARWKAFRSVALGSARGPLFVADLAAGSSDVTKATEHGLWGMDSTGLLWPLLREGDSLQIGDASLNVSRFTTLSPALGAEGTIRGVSASGAHIVIQAKLSDGSQALLKVVVP
jgi:hypothetical protein